ncbi:hypothetical protein BZG05_13000 [Salinivibrio kushneri]|nr:hypothetical protein BZG05_13000 [Salinivibrio kushneri]
MQNFGHTDSYTDGSSSKYVTAKAVKDLKEYADNLIALIPKAGTSYLKKSVNYGVGRYDERGKWKTIYTFQRSGRCTVWLRQENVGDGYGRYRLYLNSSIVARTGRINHHHVRHKVIRADISFNKGDTLKMYIRIDDNRASYTTRFMGRIYTGNDVPI